MDTTQFVPLVGWGGYAVVVAQQNLGHTKTQYGHTTGEHKPNDDSTKEQGVTSALLASNELYTHINTDKHFSQTEKNSKY